jgi:hypothetical protein
LPVKLVVERFWGCAIKSNHFERDDRPPTFLRRLRFLFRPNHFLSYRRSALFNAAIRTKLALPLSRNWTLPNHLLTPDS